MSVLEPKHCDIFAVKLHKFKLFLNISSSSVEMLILVFLFCGAWRLSFPLHEISERNLWGFSASRGS